MSPKKIVTISAALALATVAVDQVARADDDHPTTVVVVPEQARAPRVSSVPNGPMIWSGLFTFAVPYTISVVVGATSKLDQDRFLFIPLVGPWIDFATRPGCPTVLGTCAGETAARVGLGFDGAFQGLGAVAFVSGFFWRREVVVSDSMSFIVTPYGGRGSGGLVAAGHF